jgi:hypothetical protein
MIHLPFLIGKLTGAESGSFVHHQRRGVFGVTLYRVEIEKILNQRPL